MRKLALVLVVLGLMGPFASTFHGQEIPKELLLGKWTGTRTPNNNNPAAVTQNVTFEFSRVPDPHERWRIGPGFFFSATMIVNQQTRFPLRDIRLEADSLSLVIEQPQPNELQCILTRQKDGSFEGLCPRIRDKMAGFRVTMVPPKETALPTETKDKE